MRVYVCQRALFLIRVVRELFPTNIFHVEIVFSLFSCFMIEWVSMVVFLCYEIRLDSYRIELREIEVFHDERKEKWTESKWLIANEDIVAVLLIFAPIFVRLFFPRYNCFFFPQYIYCVESFRLELK